MFQSSSLRNTTAARSEEPAAIDKHYSSEEKASAVERATQREVVSSDARHVTAGGSNVSFGPKATQGFFAQDNALPCHD